MKTSEPYVIELKLREITQLFNSMDPSPFHEKDLDHDAEEFIVGSAQEAPSQSPLLLKIHLEQCPESDPTETIRQAVNHYFEYRSEIVGREFRHLMKQARTTLAIGILFLASCLLAGNAAQNYGGGSVWANFLSEGFTIAGWVAMWKPIQAYLYDWWPVKREIKLYRKLSRVPVEIVRGK